MKPYQILKELSSNPKALKDASDEFWHGCYHGTSESPYPIKFSVSDPFKYGNGIPDNLFPKVINGMNDGSLNEDDFAIAMGKFSINCQETEWLEWFKPILNKTLSLPISNREFNKYAPEEYQLDTVPQRDVISLTDARKLPKNFFFEPYYDLPIYHWHLTPKGVFIYDEYGERFDHPAIDSLYDVEKILNDTIILEGILDDDLWIFRDILTAIQFSGNQPSLPLEYRLQLLVEFYRQVLEPRGEYFAIADVYKGTVGDDSNNTRTSFNLLVEQGFTQVLIRDITKEYFEGSDILVNPDRQSILTCTDITTSEELGDDVAEYIHGRGRIDKKSFNTPVFHGLTFDIRTEMMNKKDSFIGERFVVMSCGLASDGKLLFPIFKHWR